MLCSMFSSKANSTAAPASTTGQQQRERWCTCNSRSCRLVFLRSVKLLLRVCGISVSLLFAVCRGAWTLTGPHVDSFWNFSDCVSQVLLGIMVVCTSLCLEVAALSNSQHFAKYMLNRLGAGAFYLWIGFESFATVGSSGDATAYASQPLFTAGVVAWALSWANLTISCTAEEIETAREIGEDVDSVVEKGHGSLWRSSKRANSKPSSHSGSSKPTDSRATSIPPDGRDKDLASTSHPKRGSPPTTTKPAPPANTKPIE